MSMPAGPLIGNKTTPAEQNGSAQQGPRPTDATNPHRHCPNQNFKTTVMYIREKTMRAANAADNRAKASFSLNSVAKWQHLCKIKM